MLIPGMYVCMVCGHGLARESTTINSNNDRNNPVYLEYQMNRSSILAMIQKQTTIHLKN